MLWGCYGARRLFDRKERSTARFDLIDCKQMSYAAVLEWLWREIPHKFNGTSRLCKMNLSSNEIASCLAGEPLAPAPNCCPVPLAVVKDCHPSTESVM